MDRDMVNCLHYIYQWTQISAQRMADEQRLPNGDPRRIFWCPGDTRNPLENSSIISTGADGAIELPGAVYDLLDRVDNQMRSMPQPDFVFGFPLSAPIRARGAERPAFLAIPYASEFDAVKQCVLDTARAANFCCEVTGDLASPGDIVDQVWNGIRGSDVVVADATGCNPNVFYEIGIAHALGKEVIIMSQDLDVPFDIRGGRKLKRYNINDLTDLATDLCAAFEAVSARYPHEGPEPRW
jgi:hypothetical protein